MNSSFLPINNHYSSIDLNTLKKVSLTKNNKGLQKSSIQEISKYLNQLKNNNLGKEKLILNSKKVIPVEIPKSSYYDKIDMLKFSPSQVNKEVIIQKYLKSFTTLDIELAQSKSNVFEFKNSKILPKNISKILEYSFLEMNSVVSTPYFYISPRNVIINLFVFVVNTDLRNHLRKLQGLSLKLTRYFKKPVKLELTQLYSVGNNSEILAKILGKLGLSRRNSFARITGRFLRHQSNKIFFRSNQNKYSKFNSILTGVNIVLGGRLMRGKIIPRRTIKKIQYGSLARSKSNYVSISSNTQKNKRGSFTFTVQIEHKFF